VIDLSTKAFGILFILTAYNLMLAALMIFGVAPVWLGMLLAFAGMTGIVIASIAVLMPGQRPWRRPSTTKGNN